jgi:hypothetical protein
MPMHDWTLVEAGIFHAFHHNWITTLSSALNEGVLPKGYYALPEQQAAGFGPDVLTLQGRSGISPESTSTTALLERPTTRFMAQSDAEFAYECELTTRAYIETVAVGDLLPDMPLFLAPNGCVQVPLESTYDAAFQTMPSRWRNVLQPA